MVCVAKWLWLPNLVNWTSIWQPIFSAGLCYSTCYLKMLPPDLFLQIFEWLMLHSPALLLLVFPTLTAARVSFRTQFPWFQNEMYFLEVVVAIYLIHLCVDFACHLNLCLQTQKCLYNTSRYISWCCFYSYLFIYPCKY